ncbi:MAG: hypothetical protein KDD43_11515, partial [Bdellovibrionales bacterium]|nr:hypothetical protein [Bdellovibrionales bacterium]
LAKSWAFELPQLKKGTGARFDLELSSGKAEVAITVAESSNKEVALEYYFKDLSFIGIEMWQRFHVRPQGKKLQLSDGYVLMPQFGQAMKLTPDYLQGFDGVQVSSFMMGSEDELNAHKIGVEKITVPAGTVEAVHYRVKERDQTIDFWVHESAKPVGIVKIVSSGKEIKHNYTMQLKSLLQNSSPKIDPKKAGPLTKEAKTFLPKVGTSLMVH